MNIEKYEELSGIKIADNKRAFIQSKLNRVQSKLEILLGYTLSPQSIYTELGKSKTDCFISTNTNNENLLASDAVRGSIRVFNYNPKDEYLAVDPFYEVYSVKLVQVKDNHQFVTYHTFDNVVQQYGANGIGKWVKKCEICGGCSSACWDCFQLAVDGRWINFDEKNGVPQDLLYLFVDMVDYYSNPYREIKSESVDGHSWSKDSAKAPEENSSAIILLKKYAGPFGSVITMPTL